MKPFARTSIAYQTSRQSAIRRTAFGVITTFRREPGAALPKPKRSKRVIHEYDVTLKKLLQTSADAVLGQTLGELHISGWLNVELLPPSQTRRADLVGATTGGGLVHIELQSTNDSTMPLRMAEYALRIYGQFGELPRQLVLYVGQPALRMSASLLFGSPIRRSLAAASYSTIS